MLCSYGAIWTGDNDASWKHLEAAQPMLLSMSIAGLPFVGCMSIYETLLAYLHFMVFTCLCVVKTVKGG